MIKNLPPSDLKSEIDSKKKVALICAGGGVTGGVYEIGCLKALDGMLVNRRVNDFDIFVGTSAGSVVASALAFGVTPEELFKASIGAASNFGAFNRSSIFKINAIELFEKLLLAPKTIYQIFDSFRKNRGDISFYDSMLQLNHLIPSGIFDNSSLEKFIRDNFSRMGKEDSFRSLPKDKELYIIAVDLDTGERTIFGEASAKDVPISKAVTASCALPLLYKPVRIKGRDYIDGSILKTVHMDVPMHHGADLIICINPLVPVFNNPEAPHHTLSADAPRHLSQRGLLTVLDQVFRIAIHSRLQYGIEQYSEKFPEVDIILIEPDRTDYVMFFYNIMRYSARVLIAEHGFKKTREKLEERFSDYREIFLRHGIRISRRIIDEEYEEMKKDQFSVSAIVRVLASLTGNNKESKLRKSS